MDTHSAWQGTGAQGRYSTSLLDSHTCTGQRPEPRGCSVCDRYAEGADSIATETPGMGLERQLEAPHLLRKQGRCQAQQGEPLRGDESFLQGAVPLKLE